MEGWRSRAGRGLSARVSPPSVFTTDAWHFFKFLTILCLYAALFAPFNLVFRWPRYGWVLLYFAFDVPRGLIFELLYSRLLL